MMVQILSRGAGLIYERDLRVDHLHVPIVVTEQKQRSIFSSPIKGIS